MILLLLFLNIIMIIFIFISPLKQKDSSVFI